MKPNYFSSRLSAARYAAARPAIHADALSVFVTRTRAAVPVGMALDVGCGTGQSTIALLSLSRRVVGVDPSDAMLAQCAPDPRIAYIRARGENIPARDGMFDLVSAGLAFHWFDQSAFLAQAHRVLARSGWLVLYNAWFTGVFAESSTLSDWFKEQYLSRYPAPPRISAPITVERARNSGFELRGEANFTVEERMSIRRFTDYQLSTSNIIAAVSENTEQFLEAERWILKSVRPYFDGYDERGFQFDGKVSYLQKPSSDGSHIFQTS